MIPSPSFPRALLAIVLGPLLAVSACGSGDGGGDGASGSTGSAPSACAQDNRKDVYTAGLSKKTASELSVKIMESTPAPPAKLTNAMTLQLLDAGGLPLDGATLSVLPFMPDHGHGSAVTPTVTPKGGGVYAVANLYFPMPGLWRVTVTVQLPDTAPQDVAFSFCIDG
jgi:YtkA-like